MSVGRKTCRRLRKGFLGCWHGRERGLIVVVSSEVSQNSQAEAVITGQRTAHLSIPVLLLRVRYPPDKPRTSITHSPHPYSTHIHNTNTLPHPGHSLPCQTRAPTSHCTPTATATPSTPIQSTRPSQPFRKLRYRRTASPAVPPRACDNQRPALPFPRRPRPCTRIAKYSTAHVSTYIDYANDAPRLGWAWTPDVPHSRRRQTSALWTTRAALELKSLPT